MDWNTLIDQLGGGLSAIIILGLGWAYWKKDSQLLDAIEKRFEREREHSKELNETIQAARDIQGGAK